MPGERAVSPSMRGRIAVSSTCTAPRAAIIISGVTPPGRKILGNSPVMSTTVDSNPTSQGPPSSTMSMRPSMSSSTCSARVGLGRPERLALGAATGTPAFSISIRAAG